MMVEKCVILAFFQIRFWADVKKIILSPFKHHPKIEVVIVVLIVPFIMNVRTTSFRRTCQIIDVLMGWLFKKGAYSG